MRWIKLFLTILAVPAVLGSCKKDIKSASADASLTVVNASADNSNIVATISDTTTPFYTNVAPISYGSFAEYGNPAGVTPLTLVSSTDTTRPLFQGKFNLKGGGIYSFYISGQLKNLDTMLVQDFIVNYDDSLAGIRFVNLSPGSGPISVNIQGNSPSQIEFTNLSYKITSPFKAYPATNGITSYTFEVRDQSTGNLLTTFTWNLTIFKNNTLVISNAGDPTSINVFQVNNF